MKKYFSNIVIFLKEALIDDKNNRYLFLSSFTLALLSYIIWKRCLDNLDQYAIPKIEIFPVKFLSIIFAINLVLGLSSYSKEKEITYLLFIGNLLVSALVMILEIYYLVNLR